MKRTAVIIEGNREYMSGPGKTLMDPFYNQIHSYLEQKGYSVTRDPGLPYTSPPKADLWIGHSRGCDRLRFAPQGTKTIAFGTNGNTLKGTNTIIVNHPLEPVNDRNATELSNKERELSIKDPRQRYHFMFTDKMKAAIDSVSMQKKAGYQKMITKSASNLELASHALLGLGIGVPLIQMIRGASAGSHASAVMEKDLTPIDLSTIPKDVRLLRNVKDVNNYIKETKLRDPILKWGLRAMVEESHNAGFLASPSKGKPSAVILGEGFKGGGKVLAHELGHYKDFVQSDSPHIYAFTDYINKHDGGFLQRLWDPKTDGTYRSEVRAWDQSPYKEDDELRQAALKTYEIGAQSTRLGAFAIPALLGSSILAGLAEAEKKVRVL